MIQASGLSRAVLRLRLFLVVSLLVIALPLALFTYKARQQIKWEALYQQRALAEELSQRVDQSLQSLIAREDARAATDFQFLTATSLQPDSYLQRSPLSEWSPNDAPPGLLGYFQVDGNGNLQSPLLPDQQDPVQWGLSPTEIAQRQQRVANLRDILTHNELVPRAPLVQKKDAGPVKEIEPSRVAGESRMSVVGNNPLADAQANFDRLSTSQKNAQQQKTLGKIADLKLEAEWSKAKGEDKSAIRPLAQSIPTAFPVEKRANRKEQLALPAPVQSVAQSLEQNAAQTAAPVRLFASEIEPYEWTRLDSGHLLFYRKVWRNGERLVQGFLLNENEFFETMLARNFQGSTLASSCNLVLAYRGDVIRIFAGNEASALDRKRYSSASDISGVLALQQRLSAPLSDLTLIYSVVALADGPAGAYINGIAVVIFILLLSVFALFYRLGLRQLQLARQQQDFIASVSHELKTPLTSIRMFGEMLREGWVTPAKQKEYYDFICDESERLTRLISNVLQLARMERQDLQLDIKPQSLAVLADLLRSRVQSQIDRNGFELQFRSLEAPANIQLMVDADALIQVVLNLVDNGIKFSRTSTQKRIDVEVSADAVSVNFTVRDFGPGVPLDQQQKIFDLFYRVGNELTRDTQGTGIGLALVRQLARAMAGKVSVCNVQPGAEFTLSLPRLKS